MSINIAILIALFILMSFGVFIYFRSRGSRSIVLEVPERLRDPNVTTPADTTPTRVRITTPLLRDAGREAREGDVMTVPAHCANNWIDSGWAEEVNDG